ncbi:N-acyl-aliphatic-L-amino acid amidohydrolase [Sarracenia purpurea var. burkii]
MGRPLMTFTNDSNPWWSVFEEAVRVAGGKLSKPEILPSTTDARYIRQMGIPTLGFSPMKNTPILLHDHNEIGDSSGGRRVWGDVDILDTDLMEIELWLLRFVGKNNDEEGDKGEEEEEPVATAFEGN